MLCSVLLVSSKTKWRPPCGNTELSQSVVFIRSCRAKRRMISPSFTVTAPGKIILHGEHAVVYGKVVIFSFSPLNKRVLNWFVYNTL